MNGCYYCGVKTSAHKHGCPKLDSGEDLRVLSPDSLKAIDHNAKEFEDKVRRIYGVVAAAVSAATLDVAMTAPPDVTIEVVQPAKVEKIDATFSFSAPKDWTKYKVIDAPPPSDAEDYKRALADSETVTIIASLDSGRHYSEVQTESGMPEERFEKKVCPT